MSDLPVTSVSGRDGWKWQERVRENSATVAQQQSTSPSEMSSTYNYRSDRFDSLPLRRQVTILKQELEHKERQLEQKDEYLNAIVEQYEQKLSEAKEGCSDSSQRQSTTSDDILSTVLSFVSDSR